MMPSGRATATERLAALKRRLRDKWDQEQRVTAREPDPPPSPTLPVGSTTRRADASGAVEVAQHRDAAEASHLSPLPATRAAEREEVDDVRGSKRRRLLATLAAPAPAHALSYRVTPHYVVSSCNVTRPDASNAPTMLMNESDGEVMIDGENAVYMRESKRQRIL
jgi:hypothetical protein